jgi:hypothetical protein
MKKLNAIFLLSALIFASACEEDDEPEAPLSIKTQMLINPTVWETAAIALYDTETREYYEIPEELNLDLDCFNDNTLKFNKNGNFEASEGSDLCDEEEQTSTGTWKFNSSETKITFTDEEGPDEVDIVALTEEEFVVSTGETIPTEIGDLLIVIAFEAKE